VCVCAIRAVRRAVELLNIMQRIHYYRVWDRRRPLQRLGTAREKEG
jgi:hypothetical protein